MTATRKNPGHAGSRRRLRITDRDDAILRFVGTHVAVEAAQLVAWTGMDRSNLQRRLAQLVRHGLLTHERYLYGRPGVYSATDEGLLRARLGLSSAHMNLSQYDHALGLVWLHIELEREFGPSGIVTERMLRLAELRAAETAAQLGEHYQPRYAASLVGGAGRVHFPDLAVELGAPRGGLLCVELELTPKTLARRREIIAGYRASGEIEQVRYYAPPDQLRALRRALDVERVGRRDALVDLRPWAMPAGAAR